MKYNRLGIFLYSPFSPFSPFLTIPMRKVFITYSSKGKGRMGEKGRKIRKQ
jgi:hypothetical protein